MCDALGYFSRRDTRDTPIKEEFEEGVSRNLKLTLLVMPWIMIPMHGPCLPIMKLILQVRIRTSGGVCNQRLNIWKQSKWDNGLNKLDHVSPFMTFRGHCKTLCCASHLLSEALWVSLYLLRLLQEYWGNVRFKFGWVFPFFTCCVFYFSICVFVACTQLVFFSNKNR